MEVPNLDIKIPVDLLKEFKMEPRVVARFPWPIGIPPPEVLLNQEIVKRFDKAGFALMFVPKQFLR